MVAEAIINAGEQYPANAVNVPFMPTRNGVRTAFLDLRLISTPWPQ